MKIKYNILTLLYICILLNLIPIALLGSLKIPSNIYTILYAICYVIQCLLMIIDIKQNDLKMPRKFASLLIIIVINCVLSSVFSIIKFGTIDYNELFFMISLIINIYIFIIIIYK